MDANQESKPKATKTAGTWAIASFVASIVPIYLFTYCFIVSGDSFNEGSNGAVW